MILSSLPFLVRLFLENLDFAFSTSAADSSTTRHPPMSCICDSFIVGYRRSLSTIVGTRFSRCVTSPSKSNVRRQERRPLFAVTRANL